MDGFQGAAFSDLGAERPFFGLVSSAPQEAPAEPVTATTLTVQRLEDLEPGTARGAQAAAQNAAGDRGGLPRLQRRDGLKAAAIFVPDGKTVQEIFDGDEPDARQVGRAPGSDALQVLQGRLEVWRHCTIIA